MDCGIPSRAQPGSVAGLARASSSARCARVWKATKSSYASSEGTATRWKSCMHARASCGQAASAPATYFLSAVLRRSERRAHRKHAHLFGVVALASSLHLQPQVVLSEPPAARRQVDTPHCGAALSSPGSLGPPAGEALLAQHTPERPGRPRPVLEGWQRHEINDGRQVPCYQAQGSQILRAVREDTPERWRPPLEHAAPPFPSSAPS